MKIPTLIQYHNYSINKIFTGNDMFNYQDNSYLKINENDYIEYYNKFLNDIKNIIYLALDLYFFQSYLNNYDNSLKIFKNILLFLHFLMI